MRIIKSVLLSMVLLLLIPIGLFAQQTATLKGKLIDDTDMPLIGASVVIEGTTIGSTTDIDGNYSVSAIQPGTYTVVFSFIGFIPIKESITLTAGQTLVKNHKLETNSVMLNEAVVIGYGTTNAKDLTGSTKVISNKDFANGNITTPEQLITGKVSGVQITSNNGAPGSGSTIRIRGGTSINASNDPLIVIDGVPLDNGSIAGAPNPLSLINPNDIESFVVLKDASAAAIYGSRGANGVIIITTKKGAEGNSKLTVNLQQNTSISMAAKYVSVMDSTDFKNAVRTYGTPTQQALLGEANTDWQKEIYRKAVISETNVSVSGGIKALPYRFSAGYKHEEGILQRDVMDRTSLGLNLNPKLLKKALSVDVSAKYSGTNTVYADRGAIGSAISFDPTQPVNAESERFGGYFEWLTNKGIPNPLAPKNPVGLLYQKDDFGNANRFIGNVKLDYKLPFMPDLHVVVNGGMDYANGHGTVTINDSAASNYIQGGNVSEYNQTKNNRVLETYLNYSKKYAKIKSDVDFTAGYSFQKWRTESDAFATLNVAGDTLAQPGIPGWNENALMSYYGRLIYTYNGRYLLTATLRRDGSSRFSPENRWGLFPSVAFAWRISDESFLKESKIVSNLKLRAGYGVTGQQDIGNDYPYIANYQTSTSTAEYQLGNQFYSLLRPDGFDYNIKWEQTASSNIGLDYGFLNDKIYGTLDFYLKKTTGLLAVIPVPAGANFKNQILTNVGELENKGVEFEVNYVAIRKTDKLLTFGANLTANRNKIINLTAVPDSNSVGILTGGISGAGIGNNVQVHSAGYPTNSFYVFKQKYDENGKPLLNEFEDLNGDSIINNDDRYRFEKTVPDFMIGFFTNFKYKKWSAGFSVRTEIGRYVYNNINSSRGFYSSVPSQDFLTNLNYNFTDYGFLTTSTNQTLSDLYVERADFIRMDYLQIGYEVGKVFNGLIDINASFVVNNVFMITNYSGLDPEISSGIDNNLYPRPRIYSLNLNFKF